MLLFCFIAYLRSVRSVARRLRPSLPWSGRLLWDVRSHMGRSCGGAPSFPSPQEPQFFCAFDLDDDAVLDDHADGAEAQPA